MPKPTFQPAAGLLKPPVFRDAHLNETASLVYWIAISLMTAAVLTVPILVVTSAGAVLPMVGFVVGLGAVSVAALLVVRFGRPMGGARLMVFGTIAMASWFFVNSGGIGSPAIAGMMIPVAMAGVMLRYRDAAIAAGIAVLAGFAITVFQTIGIIQPIAWDNPWLHAVFLAVDAVCVIALVLVGATHRNRATELVRKANEELSLAGKVYETTSEGVVVTTPDGSIVDVNDAFLRMHALERADVIGQNPRIMKSGRHPREFYDELWATLLDTGQWQGEIWDRRSDGSMLPKWLSISTVTDDEGTTTHYVGVFSDISVIKKGQEDLEWLATHDPLTALPNRALLWSRLSAEVARSRRYESNLAVLYFDLDHFKDVNDTLGHAMGDRLLVEIAHRCMAVVRESDMLGRMGGDEFTVIASNYASVYDLKLLAERLLQAVEKTVHLDESDALVTASIGIAIFPKDGADAASIATHADVAMYRAKELGKNRVELFDEAMQDDIERRIQVETALRRTISEDRLFLVYQPQVNLRTGKVTGIEALVRWREPDGSVVMPDEFIPVAEATGLILELGGWVLRRACADMRVLRDSGHALTMAINFSARQFMEQDVARDVLAAAALEGIQPGSLEVEVTESAIMVRTEVAANKIRELLAAGVLVSIDDFGTGYASMSYIQEFHPTKIKIDRSFVSQVPMHSSARAIVNATVALAKGIGAEALAEGPDTEEQVRFLLEAGCDSAQGYYFSKPLPIAELLTLLEQGPVAVPRLAGTV